MATNLPMQAHILYFGLELDGPTAPLPNALGVQHIGPRQLLRVLEGMLGLSGYRERNDYLRIEMYRQALQQHLSGHPKVFYAASFAADRFATATALLERRDQLVLSGWDFAPGAGAGRLPTLAAVEAIFQAKAADPANLVAIVGTADRWRTVLRALEKTPPPIGELVLYEPFGLQPPHIAQLVAVLQQHDIPVAVQPTLPQAALSGGQLAHLQHYLMGEKKKDNHAPTLGGAPEIVFLHARSDADLATFLAQALAQNPDWEPHFLIPNLRQPLELALTNEGLPPLGILSATLARPALQVLKLAPAFLWEPVDVFKLMEFVTLQLKPLDRGLALEIARVLAEKPGLYSDNWYGAVLGYLQKEGVDAKAKEQYDFWFQRRRYGIDKMAPKAEVVEIYEYLQNWASEYYEQATTKDNSLLTLAAQAGRIKDLLLTLPEQWVGYLELERIVRTIVEPAPAFFADTAAGHYPFFHQTGAAIAPMDELVWWNCLFEEDMPPPDFWQPAERAWLDAQHCAPEHPRQLAQRKLLLRMRPVLQTRRRLWLCLPEQVGGLPTVHHLLASDIATLLGETASFSFHIGDATQRAALAKIIQLPAQHTLEPRLPLPPQALLHVDWHDNPDQRDETPTGLESLFYYPHRWYLRQKLGLYPSNLLSVTRDSTLLGNLAHRFFELLLPDPTFANMDRAALHQWVDDKADKLLSQEGATLLMYGREPERKVFLQKVKLAAWNLTSMLRNNGWSVLATEKTLEGRFAGVHVSGKADLVLQRGSETAIVDLKWGGMTKRKELIKNEEDLQLVLYAHLLPPEGTWPHTAYFILESGKMIARNRIAFQEALAVGKTDEDHGAACCRIFEKMEKTFAWRMAQLQRGELEIRTEQTALELEDMHAAVLADLLEMKREDARYDDYATLIQFMQ